MGHMPSALSSPLAELARQAASAYTAKPSDQPVLSPAFIRLLTTILAQAPRLLGHQVGSAEILSAGMRSVVVRVGSAGSTSAGPISASARGRTAVLKYFRRKDSASNSGGFGYLREKHGLAALDQIAPGLYPKLLATDDEARLLALEDVAPPPHQDGKSISQAWIPLADFFTGNPADQKLALTAYTETWAQILTSPHQEKAASSFTSALAAADPAAPRPGAQPSPRLAIKGLNVLAHQAGLEPDSPQLALWHNQVHSIIYPAPTHQVLSSGDFSPTNLLIQPQPAGTNPSATPRIRAIDAEGTCLHHWALPLAEMRLGFPSWPDGPLPSSLISTPIWRTATDNLYRRIAPTPLPHPTQDPHLAAAQLTIQATLAEQQAGTTP